MKRIATFSIYIIFIQMFCCLGIHAQSDTTTVSISGEILDGENKNEGVAWATIQLFPAADSSKVYTTATDTEGAYRLTGVGKGKYRMEMSCVGYENVVKDITLATDTILPTFTMKTSAKMLDEVKVNATYTKMNEKGDYLVQVKGNPLAKVSSTEDFLSTIRGVSTIGGLWVFGRQDVVIVLNDRVVSYEQLKNIPTSMIERIEFKQQAPTEYAQSGTRTPLMRIILRNEAGLLGSIWANPSCNNKNMGISGSSSFLFSSGKFSIMEKFDNYNGTLKSTDEQNTFYEDHNTHQETESKNKAKLDISNDLNMRYSFTELDYVDVTASYTKRKTDNSLLNTGDEALYNQYDANNNYSTGVSMRAQKSLNKDGNSSIIVKASYAESHSEDGRDYDIFSTGLQSVNLKANRYDWDFSAIANYAIGNHTLSAGISYGNGSSINHNTGIGSQAVKYMDDVESKLYTAQTHGWLGYSNFIANRYYLSAEVNFDHYQVKYEDWLNSKNNTRNTTNGVYWDLSCYIPFNAQKQHYLNLSARYTFSYPNYGYYFPFVSYQNDKLYSKGNSNLDVEKLYMFSIAYSANQHLSMTYDYEFRNKLVSVFMHQDANDPTMFYTSPENAGHYNLHNLSVNYRVDPFKIWTLNASLTGYYQNTNTPNIKLDEAAVLINVYNNLRFTNQIGMNLNFRCNSPRKSVSQKISWSYNFDLVTYGSFCKNRLYMNLYFGSLLYKKKLLTTIGDGWTMERKRKSTLFYIAYNIRWNFSVGKQQRGRRMESVRTTSKVLPTL